MSKSETRQIALAALFGALYIAANWIPFSQYIGGAGFITASVVLVPVIAALLSPRYAIMAGLIGGLGINVFMTGYAMVMPWYSILIPAVAVGLGSYAFHESSKALYPAAFLALEGLVYLFYYGFKATPLFLTHYVIGIIFALYYWNTGKFKTGLIFTVAMCGNAMLNIGSMFILALPAELWGVIFPASFLERAIASIGAYFLIQGIKRALPTTYLPGIEDI